jgi:outer membrane protein assembly factor BamB
MAQNTSPQRVIFPENVARLRRIWTYTAGDAIESSPVVAGGIVYFSSQDHYVYAIEARAGKKRWSYMTGGALSTTPAFAD